MKNKLEIIIHNEETELIFFVLYTFSLFYSLKKIKSNIKTKKHSGISLGTDEKSQKTRVISFVCSYLTNQNQMMFTKKWNFSMDHK